MDIQEIRQQLELIRDNMPLSERQQEAMEIVLNEYSPGLTIEQIIRLIEILVSIMMMTNQ